MHACFSRKKNTLTFLLSLIPQGVGRGHQPQSGATLGAEQDHASAVARDSGPGPQWRGQGEIRPAVLPSRRPPAVVGHLLTQLRGARWRRLPPHLRPHREASDPSACAHGLPAPRPRPALMLPPASVLGGQGRAPTSLQKGTVREEWASGLGAHRPPEQTRQEKEDSGDERGNRRSAHQGIPSAAPICSFHLPPHVRPASKVWGTRTPRSLCWPRRSETTSPERISLPLQAGSPARPPHPSFRSCPWKPSPRRQAFPAACCLHPQPSSPAILAICNAFFGEVSILLLCLIFGSVVCLPVEL